MKTIPLQGSLVCRVSDEDFEELGRYRWHGLYDRHSGGFYAARHGFRKDGVRTTVLMHRQILGAGRGIQVDHIDHDTLNNCRENIRLCTSSENARNRRLARNSKSGYKGVTFRPSIKARPWEARIKLHGALRSLGCFTTAKEAHDVYCAAAKVVHGEFNCSG